MTRRRADEDRPIGILFANQPLDEIAISCEHTTALVHEFDSI
jgi:hypothetical protein